MKHRFIVSAALTAAALSLAACAPAAIVDPSSATSAPTASPTETYTPAAEVDPNVALADMKWVDNGADVAPGIEFTSPVNFSATGGRLVTDGDGAALSAGQALTLKVVQLSGNDGSVADSTYASGVDAPLALDTATLDPILFDLLTSAHVGAQVLYAVPDQGAGAAIVAFVVASATDVLARAEGDAVASVPGLPTVTLDADGKPSVTYDGATKSTDLVAQDLITGSGPVVVEGQSLTVHYTGWLWDGAQFDSSWDRGSSSSFTIATGALIDGWVQGLVGKTVGSQVLLVIPPELAYGDTGQGEAIPAGSTLVFVVDILAAT